MFVDNIFLKGMRFVRTIRSPVRCGKLLSIDCPVLPEGYRLIRAADIPGQNCLPGPDAGFDLAFSHPILAGTRLLYEGQPVALLVGPEPRELAMLEAAIRVNAEEAEIPVRVYAERNIIVETGGRGRQQSRDTDLRPSPHAAKKNGEKKHGEEPPQQPRIVETSHSTPCAEHNAPECNGAVAFFEGDRCFVHTASQWPRHVQRSVAGVLGLNPDGTGIVVGRESPGVHFDAKLWYPSLIAAQAALAASVTRTPVKFMLTREEERLYSPRRAASALHIRSETDESGRILKTDIMITADLGMCGFFAEEIIDRMALASLGLYRLGTVTIQAKAVGTASVPKGAFAGFGMAQGFFAIERHLAHVTDELHVSPLQWKLERNIEKQGGSPVKLPIGITVKKPLDIRSVIETASARSDFDRKWAAYALLSRRENPAVNKVSPMRGIGLAFAYQGAGLLYHTSNDPLPHVTAVLEDGELVIKCATPKETAPYIETWKNIARDAVCPDHPAASIRYDDSGSDWGDDPAVLSRSAACITGLVEDAVRDAVRGAMRGVSQPPDAPEDRSEARYRSEDAENWAGKTCDHKAFAHPALCAAVIEVEIDQAEYKPLVRGIRLCVDGGRILSVSGARNLLTVSGIAALAWAQGKRKLPYIKDVPRIEIEFITADNEHNGENSENKHVAGLEELAFSTIPAAYASAVSQALGVPFDSLPIRPLEIWRALHPASEGKGGEE
ncbi:MAG: molybdopterin-dependent oxidoreductase [Spirochaetaceae bacterium]|nr:molybdopterin-dependent oxidoreductase [Spirochaetaceae bacterium]